MLSGVRPGSKSMESGRMGKTPEGQIHPFLLEHVSRTFLTHYLPKVPIMC
jgi:hypothetical protein